MRGPAEVVGAAWVVLDSSVYVDFVMCSVMAAAGYGARGRFFSGRIRRGRDLVECINGLLRDGRLRLVDKVREETKGVTLGKVEGWLLGGQIRPGESRRLFDLVNEHVGEGSADMGRPPAGCPDDDGMLEEVGSTYEMMWTDPRYRRLLDELREKKYRGRRGRRGRPGRPGGRRAKPRRPGPGDMLILSTAAALARRHATCLFTADSDFTVFGGVIRERLGVVIASKLDRDDWPCPRRRA